MKLRPAFALFSLNSFIAALLALYIGFSLGLPRPYWAMLTVYITSQPLSGALRSKALFRVLGTVMGAVAAVVLVPTLVNAPLLLSLAMAAWAGGCLYVSLLDRTPRAYVFMLAGYTAAIIGFPSVDAPAAIFATAVARVEEITLGIACATVVHTIVFPRDVAAALNDRVASFLGDAQTWVGDALEGRHGPQEETERRRLAIDVTELQILSTHLPFDTTGLRPRVRAVRALQDRLAMILPLLSGVEDRVDLLRRLERLPVPLAALVGDIAAWARSPEAPPAEAEALLARCAEIPSTGAAWEDLLVLSATMRLRELVEALRDCRELAAYVAKPAEATIGDLSPAVRARARRPLHRDHGLAALSAVALAGAVLACCAFWIFTGWSDGAIAAMMAAVFSSMFATQDDPAPAIRAFMGWTLASLPIVAIYLFAILPAIDGFPLLATALAPAFLVMGYLQADPERTPVAMPLLIGVAGSLALQETFTADFAGFLNSNIALVCGIAVALGSTRLLRTVSAGWSARRLLRRSQREIADLAAARRQTDRDVWTSAMVDRVGLLAPRLAAIDEDEELETSDALRDLRAGLNVIDLKAASGSAVAHGSAAATALRQIAGLYHERSRGRAVDASPTIAAIDSAIEDFLGDPPGPTRARGLVALTGLRRAIGPDAPAFVTRAAA